jgi:hypothetical protein
MAHASRDTHTADTRVLTVVLLIGSRMCPAQ